MDLGAFGYPAATSAYGKAPQRRPRQMGPPVTQYPGRKQPYGGPGTIGPSPQFQPPDMGKAPGDTGGGAPGGDPYQPGPILGGPLPPVVGPDQKRSGMTAAPPIVKPQPPPVNQTPTQGGGLGPILGGSGGGEWVDAGYGQGPLDARGFQWRPIGYQPPGY